MESIVNTLLRGGTLLYPTDTIWGIGCDATNPSAIEKLYQIKQRDRSKSMLILVENEIMLRRFIPTPSDEALDLLLNSDRPTTVIFPADPTRLPSNLLAADSTIGIRVPRHAFCQKLLKDFGRPIVSTSANLSGHPSPTCFNDIDEVLISQVDTIVDPKKFNIQEEAVAPSRIIKVTPSGETLIIRP